MPRPRPRLEWAVGLLVLAVLLSVAADEPMGFDEGIWFHVARAWVDDGVERVPERLSRLAVVEGQILEALAWGASVVSTCEELAYPWYHNPESAQRIDAAAQRAGRTVLGTGVNPGWAMDTLALYASGAAQRVESIHARRVVDARYADDAAHLAISLPCVEE